MRQKVKRKNLNYSFYRIDKEKNIEVFENAGWHFNNIMTPRQISLKLKTFAHTEYSDDEFSSTDTIRKNIENRKDLKKSINLVIKSYVQKGNKNLKNQILIQKQVTNSLLSGVIFSRTPENGAPYFVINYTIGSSTDAVTKGLKTQTVKIYRNIKKSEIPIKWKKLISAIIEIEKIFKNNMLDIEFAITKNNVIIFQVRPITSIPTLNFNEIDNMFSKLIF